MPAPSSTSRSPSRPPPCAAHLAGLPRPPGRHALHIQGHHAPDLLEGVLKARELGLATSIHLTGLPEPWHRPEPVSKLFSAFDFVVMNRETAALITGVQGPAEALVEALARCSENLAGCLLLTLDHEGAVLLRDRRRALRIAAPAVQPVDATGAGDCLVGVFLAAWLNGAAEGDGAGPCRPRRQPVRDGGGRSGDDALRGRPARARPRRLIAPLDDAERAGHRH